MTKTMILNRFAVKKNMKGITKRTKLKKALQIIALILGLTIFCTGMAVKLLSTCINIL